MSEQQQRKKLGEMGEKLYRYSEHGYTTCTTEPVCDGHPYGLFFTPDELRELIAIVFEHGVNCVYSESGMKRVDDTMKREGL